VRIIRFYHRATGLLTPNTLIVSDDRMIEPNTPADHCPIDESQGRAWDHLSQRVAVEESPDAGTGLHRIVDWQPFAPSADHEWHAESKRWRLNAATQMHMQLRAGAPMRRRQLIEWQHDHIRKLVLDPQNADARTALAHIDQELTELQPLLD
jgi:hypothetical protein